jgi:hypothetical protein
MSAVPGLIIDRAHNGWIVRKTGSALGSLAPLPMVFDSFERLVDYLREVYGVQDLGADDIAWNSIVTARPKSL